METDPQIQSGDSIDARQSQGFLNHPSGSVTQTFVTYEAAKPRIPLERPARAEHFQDRKDELAQLLTDLHPGKVVTLCGPGGMGKTALAAEALWHLAPNNQPPARFPDGILFHTFYGQSQVALALEHIARSFGEELRPSPKEAAQRALAGRCVLLLLDGTEEADDLPALLAIRNNCGVLITSRSRKDAESMRQDLAPLPPDDAIALLQAWGGERAADRTAAQEISQLVDCLPLALRLAGRYLAQNEEDASDYLIWLKATPLAALDQGKRQEESISLLLEHSLAQVSERAHQVLGVAGILAPVPFEVAAIAKALSLSDREARQALGELVNYGLLIRQEVGYEVSHALIHTYASQQLAPSDAVVLQLGDYYLQTIDAHQNDFAHLHPLHPHIMTLLSIASQRKIWIVVSLLAWDIDVYLDLQGYWADRKAAITLNLAAAQAIQNRQDEGSLLGNLGSVYLNLGQVEQAIAYYQQALGIAKEIGDRRGEGNHLGNLGAAYRNLGQVEQAIASYQQALVIAKEIGDHRNEGNQLGNLGIAYTDLSQVEQAIAYIQQSLAIAKEIGDRSGECAALSNLGNVYYSLDQMEQSIAYYQQALVIAKEIGDRSGEGANLSSLGNAYYSLGQVEQAIAYHQQALVIAKEIGDRRGEGAYLGNLGLAYAALGQVEQAIASYQQALVIAKEINDRRNEGNQLGNLGNAYYSLGQVEQSIVSYVQSLVIAKEIGDRRNEGNQLGNLGNAYYSLGQVEQAIAYYQQALVIAKEIGDRRNEGNQLGNLGNAYRNLGQVGHAFVSYVQALVIAQEIGDRRGEGNHLGNLGLAYAALGQVEQAIDHYQQALVIAKEIGDRRGEGADLGNLGVAYYSLGQVEQARQYCQEALQILEKIKSPTAATVRQWLESLEK